MNVDAFLKMFTSCARGQADIEGVALVGSHARGTATKDSDVDLMILSSNYRGYFGDKEWLSLFGVVQNCETEMWGCVETLRVTYETGREIEYNFCAPSWADIPIDAGTQCVVSAGMKILFDPALKLEALQQVVPTERAVTN